jgi:hypothetical protein
VDGTALDEIIGELIKSDQSESCLELICEIARLDFGKKNCVLA